MPFMYDIDSLDQDILEEAVGPRRRRGKKLPLDDLSDEELDALIARQELGDQPMGGPIGNPFALDELEAAFLPQSARDALGVAAIFGGRSLLNKLRHLRKAKGASKEVLDRGKRLMKYMKGEPKGTVKGGLPKPTKEGSLPGKILKWTWPFLLRPGAELVRNEYHAWRDIFSGGEHVTPQEREEMEQAKMAADALLTQRQQEADLEWQKLLWEEGKNLQTREWAILERMAEAEDARTLRRAQFAMDLMNRYTEASGNRLRSLSEALGM